MVFSDLGRGILVLALILAFLQKSIGLIYVISFLVSMLGALQRPAKLGIWAESIPERKLESYNSLSELSIQLSVIVGPLIAAYFDQKNIENLGFAIDLFIFALPIGLSCIPILLTNKAPPLVTMVGSMKG